MINGVPFVLRSWYFSSWGINDILKRDGCINELKQISTIDPQAACFRETKIENNKFLAKQISISFDQTKC